MRVLGMFPDDLRSALSTPALEPRLETLGDVRWSEGDERSSGGGVRLSPADRGSR